MKRERGSVGGLSDSWIWLVSWCCGEALCRTRTGDPSLFKSGGGRHALESACSCGFRVSRDSANSLVSRSRAPLVHPQNGRPSYGGSRPLRWYPRTAYQAKGCDISFIMAKRKAPHRCGAFSLRSPGCVRRGGLRRRGPGLGFAGCEARGPSQRREAMHSTAGIGRRMQGGRHARR